jgi:hypothetical protein
MKNLSATKLYALAFGLFLGLCIWKFGNPVILDHKIPRRSPSEFLATNPWPTHWANWILLPLAGARRRAGFSKKNFSGRKPNGSGCCRSRGSAGSFFPPPQTVDADLTAATLWQFSGCVACYFLGAHAFCPRKIGGAGCCPVAGGVHVLPRARRWTSGCLNFRKTGRCWSKANAPAGRISRRKPSRR